MKKIFSIGMTAAIALLFACNPVEDRESAGTIPPLSEIKVEAVNQSPGSNRIILKNSTPQYQVIWDCIISTSVKQEDVVDLPFLGTQTIVAHVFTAGGMVDIPLEVEITDIDYPLDEQWSLLAGSDSDGKTWVWDAGNTYATTDLLGFPEPAVWGLGAGSNALYPDGSIFALGTMSIQYVVPSAFFFEADAAGKMKFDLNGAANYTYTDMTDPANPVENKGSFSLVIEDATAADYNDNPSVVSLAGAPIMGKNLAEAMAGSAGTTPDPTSFQIIKLTEDELHLRLAGEWVSIIWLLKKE